MGLLINEANEFSLRLQQQPTKVLAKAGLDNVASTMCKLQQRFGLDDQCSA